TAVVNLVMYEVYDRADRLGCERLGVGPADADPIVVLEIRGRHLAGELRAGDGERPRRVVDLVVDVGDVRHERDVVPLVLEEALEQQVDDERTRIADVDAVVDGGPARVDADAPGLARLEHERRAGARVVQADGAHGPRIYGTCGPDIRETTPRTWLLSSLWFRGEVRGVANPDDCRVSRAPPGPSGPPPGLSLGSVERASA